MKNVFLILALLFSVNCFGLQDILTFSNSIVDTKNLKSGDTVLINFNIAISEEWHVWGNNLKDKELIPTSLEIQNSVNVEVLDVVYPVGTNTSILGIEEFVLDGKEKIQVKLKITGEGRFSFDAILKYQGCNDKLCLPPKEKKVTVSLETLSGTGSSITDRLGKYGIFAAIFFLFIAGLGLNLTPCVYPIIPITLSFFAGQSEGTRIRSALLAGLYVLGIAATYSAAGTAAALSGQILGSLLQNPIVVWFIVCVFILLSLSMFGLYEISPPSFLMQQGMGRKGYLGSFAMGLIVGVVAAPCVGPVTAGLLIFVAEKKDPLLGFLYFFALSIGLGAPYFFLGLFSGSIKKLPGSGGWMVWVRKFFGFALIIMAIYYAKPLLPAMLSQWLLFISMITAAIYLGFMEKSVGSRFHKFLVFQRLFAVILLLFMFFYFKGIPSFKTTDVSVSHHAKITQLQYSALLKEGKPFILDFRAEWCAPCREFERVVLSDTSVQAILELVKLYTVDVTNENDADANEMLRMLHIVGVPTIIFYGINGTEDFRQTGFMEKMEFIEHVKRIKGEGQ